MNASKINIHWHDNCMPIYSIDIYPKKRNENDLSIDKLKHNYLITGGGDRNIRVWELKYSNKEDDGVKNDFLIFYIGSLKKHLRGVNVVRLNFLGNILATAGDDGSIIFWNFSKDMIEDLISQKSLEVDDDSLSKRSKNILLQINSSISEINDISWSSDSRHIVSASMDNGLRIYKISCCVNDGKIKKLLSELLYSFFDHNHYVQGVFWDPLNEYIASESSDRSVNIYKISWKNDRIESINIFHKFLKINNQFLYESENLQSFFRRLCFSPDGSLLITPASLDIETNDYSSINVENNINEENFKKNTNSIENELRSHVVYIYIRSNLNKQPFLKLTGISDSAVAISFNPNFYNLSESPNAKQILTLPYKMIFAVATSNSVIVYETITFNPIGIITDLHYLTISDIMWTHDGSSIILSSTDGFCSKINFDPGFFGEIFISSKV